jgi:dynein heavy chain
MKNNIVEYHARVALKLDEEVVTLEQLNETLRLLDELRDVEGKVDALYRPVEDMYALLR